MKSVRCVRPGCCPRLLQFPPLGQSLHPAAPRAHRRDERAAIATAAGSSLAAHPSLPAAAAVTNLPALASLAAATATAAAAATDTATDAVADAADTYRVGAANRLRAARDCHCSVLPQPLLHAAKPC
eukprot:scaffold61144_cov61-Phaeocystis_antarctica.AAC.6